MSTRMIYIQNQRWFSGTTRVLRLGWLPLLLIFVAACHQDMYDQPKYKPLAPSTFFDDGRSARPVVPNTVAVDQVQRDEYFLTGQVDGQPGNAFPMPVTAEMMERGRERYNINCVPCHGLSGYGNGMVGRRGGVTAANFHSERLRNSPEGHFFDVITNGYRYMYPYGDKVTAEDRWAIIAYIRALQLSQHATIDDVAPDQRILLQGMNQ